MPEMYFVQKICTDNADRKGLWLVGSAHECVPERTQGSVSNGWELGALSADR